MFRGVTDCGFGVHEDWEQASGLQFATARKCPTCWKEYQRQQEAKS